MQNPVFSFHKQDLVLSRTIKIIQWITKCYNIPPTRCLGSENFERALRALMRTFPESIASKKCPIKKHYFVNISCFCKMCIKRYARASQKILPFLLWTLLCWLCICHYEFRDSINNFYTDDVNGSRHFKRCIFFFTFMNSKIR